MDSRIPDVLLNSGCTMPDIGPDARKLNDEEAENFGRILNDASKGAFRFAKGALAPGFSRGIFTKQGTDINQGSIRGRFSINQGTVL